MQIVPTATKQRIDFVSQESLEIVPGQAYRLLSCDRYALRHLNSFPPFPRIVKHKLENNNENKKLSSCHFFSSFILQNSKMRVLVFLNCYSLLKNNFSSNRMTKICKLLSRTINLYQIQVRWCCISCCLDSFADSCRSNK